MKTLLLTSPEYYLIVLVFLSGYTPPLIVNPVSLVLIFLLVLQIIFKNPLTGVILAVLFLLTNLYMLLALISEFNEFSRVNSAAIQLLGFGLLLFTINLSASGLMIFRYTRDEGSTETQLDKGNRAF